MAKATRKNWISHLLGLFLWLIILYMLFRWFEHHQVFQPLAAHWASGAELGRLWEDTYFKAADGPLLNGWFFAADEGSASAHQIFLVCHGNGGNISHRIELCSVLLETGANVFVFDYRGYGRSQGKPSETGTYLDAQAACAWLTQRGFSPSNVIAYGESLGGAVAADLALKEPLAGLVLQSTFTSIPDIGAEIFPWLPVRLINSIKYDTIGKLPRLSLPILVMHSRADTIIPFHHGQKNFAAANHPKLFWEIAGDHNDQPDTDRGKFRDGIEKFLDFIAANRGKNDANRQP